MFITGGPAKSCVRAERLPDAAHSSHHVWLSRSRIAASVCAQAAPRSAARRREAVPGCGPSSAREREMARCVTLQCRAPRLASPTAGWAVAAGSSSHRGTPLRTSTTPSCCARRWGAPAQCRCGRRTSRARRVSSNALVLPSAVTEALRQMAATARRDSVRKQMAATARGAAACCRADARRHPFA